MKNQNSKIFKARHVTGGFTLVEIIVALGLFSIVATVALGALIKIIDANKKAQTFHAAITNLSFSLESMSREMHVGSSYQCDSTPQWPYSGDTLAPRSCQLTDQSGTSVVIAFKSSKTAPVGGGTCSLAFAYRLIQRSGVTGQWTLQKAEQPDCGTTIGGGSFSDIIPPIVVITGFNVGVTSSAFQELFIRLSGYAGVVEKHKSYFDVQTGVASRVLTL